MNSIELISLVLEEYPGIVLSVNSPKHSHTVRVNLMLPVSSTHIQTGVDNTVYSYHGSIDRPVGESASAVGIEQAFDALARDLVTLGMRKRLEEL